MARDADFERYHVLLLKKVGIGVPVLDRFRVFMSYPVFKATPIEGISTEVRVNRWRRFEGDVLRAHFGDRWPDVLASELTEVRRAFLRIDGEDAGGRRVRLPQDPDLATTAEPRKAGRRPGSGMSVLVRHLREVEGFRDYDRLLALCEASRVRWVQEALQAAGPLPSDRVAMLRKAFSNGRQTHAVTCPYCERLLEPWAGLLKTHGGGEAATSGR